MTKGLEWNYITLHSCFSWPMTSFLSIYLILTVFIPKIEIVSNILIVLYKSYLPLVVVSSHDNSPCDLCQVLVENVLLPRLYTTLYSSTASYFYISVIFYILF